MTGPTNPTGGQPEATIFIAWLPDLEVWHAVWSNQEGFVTDHDSASEAEILTWASARCDEIWIRRPGDEDYVRMPDQDCPGRDGIG
jgi:hypothetical protein